ncbi:MAG: 3-hydroxyacyl-CoA dehydrogenase NAD-binding domain-containing protein [Planctomycetota bacterium]
MTTSTLFRLALIGLGDCGVGLAERLSTTGLVVRATDPATKNLMRARTLFKALRSALVRTGLLTQESAAAADRQTHLVVNHTEALERADIVFDCLEGDLATRRTHLAQWVDLVPAQALLIVVQPPTGWEKLQENFPHPDRLIALQVTEFPSLLRRGRVQPFPATASHLRVEVTNLMLRAGLLLDTDGLASIPVMMRLYNALAREACEILAEQQINPEALDEAVRASVGPLLTALGPLEYAGNLGLEAALGTILAGSLSAAARDHLLHGGPEGAPLALPRTPSGEDGLPESWRRLSRIQMNLP